MIGIDLSLQVAFLGKIFFAFAFIIYAIFAAVVVRQVYLMTDSLEVGFENQIRILAWIHFGFALSVLLFVLFVI